VRPKRPSGFEVRNISTLAELIKGQTDGIGTRPGCGGGPDPKRRWTCVRKGRRAELAGAWSSRFIRLPLVTEA
jgi:hypothetical protein